MTNPYGPVGSAFISKSGDIAVVTVQFDTKAQNLPKDVFQQIEDATAPATKAGVKMGRRMLVEVDLDSHAINDSNGRHCAAH